MKIYLAASAWERDKQQQETLLKMESRILTSYMNTKKPIRNIGSLIENLSGHGYKKR